MAKEGIVWGLTTIVLSVVASVVTNYFTAKWALNATMYEQAMIGANDPKTPLQMRLYYLRIIAKWEGEPLTPAQQKEIAESYLKNPNATLENLAPGNPTVGKLVNQMKSTSFWDTWYGIDKSLIGDRSSEGAPSKQTSGIKVDQLPRPNRIPSKVDRLQFDGKGNQIEKQN